MEQNVGGGDRAIRIVAGIVLIGIGFVYGSWWGLLGLIPLITGLVGWCLPYHLLGINTCPMVKGETDF